LRVLAEVRLRGYQVMEAVRGTEVAHPAPGRLGGADICSVDSVPGCPIAVGGAVPEDLAPGESRGGADVEFRHAEVGRMGEARRPGGPPSAAALVLEEAVDGVERSARPASRKQQPRPGGLDHHLLRAERGEVYAWERRHGGRPGAD